VLGPAGEVLEGTHQEVLAPGSLTLCCGGTECFRTFGGCVGGGIPPLTHLPLCGLRALGALDRILFPGGPLTHGGAGQHTGDTDDGCQNRTHQVRVETQHDASVQSQPQPQP
jgi:hypothetical protein